MFNNKIGYDNVWIIRRFAIYFRDLSYTTVWNRIGYYYKLIYSIGDACFRLKYTLHRIMYYAPKSKSDLFTFLICGGLCTTGEIYSRYDLHTLYLNKENLRSTSWNVSNWWMVDRLNETVYLHHGMACWYVAWMKLMHTFF